MVINRIATFKVVHHIGCMHREKHQIRRQRQKFQSNSLIMKLSKLLKGFYISSQVAILDYIEAVCVSAQAAKLPL